MGKIVGVSDILCYFLCVYEIFIGVFNVLYKFMFLVFDCYMMKGECFVKWKRFGEFFKE